MYADSSTGLRVQSAPTTREQAFDHGYGLTGAAATMKTRASGASADWPTSGPHLTQSMTNPESARWSFQRMMSTAAVVSLALWLSLAAVVWIVASLIG